MPRVSRDSDEDVEAKSAATGRRTRAAKAAAVVTDSPVRRSTRNTKTLNIMDSSPELIDDSQPVVRKTRSRTATLDKGAAAAAITRITRSRKNSASSEQSETVESEDAGLKRVTRQNTGTATPTKTNPRARNIRAGSETKSTPPVTRVKRLTRASSVEPSNELVMKTPGRRRTRASIVPAEPTVHEEKEVTNESNNDLENSEEEVETSSKEKSNKRLSRTIQEKETINDDDTDATSSPEKATEPANESNVKEKRSSLEKSSIKESKRTSKSVDKEEDSDFDDKVELFQDIPAEEWKDGNKSRSSTGKLNASQADRDNNDIQKNQRSSESLEKNSVSDEDIDIMNVSSKTTEVLEKKDENRSIDAETENKFDEDESPNKNKNKSDEENVKENSIKSLHTPLKCKSPKKNRRSRDASITEPLKQNEEKSESKKLSTSLNDSNSSAKSASINTSRKSLNLLEKSADKEVEKMEVDEEENCVILHDLADDKPMAEFAPSNPEDPSYLRNNVIVDVFGDSKITKLAIEFSTSPDRRECKDSSLDTSQSKKVNEIPEDTVVVQNSSSEEEIEETEPSKNKSSNKSSKAETSLKNNKSLTNVSVNKPANQSMAQSLSHILDVDDSTDSEENDDSQKTQTTRESFEKAKEKSEVKKKRASSEHQTDLDKSLQKSIERMKAANPPAPNVSMMAEVGSDSEDYEKIPKFIFEADSSKKSESENESEENGDESDDSEKSIHPDIEKEYNLAGQIITKYEDDDVPGDDCRASEEEYSDPGDEGSDLDDFIISDTNEVSDEEEDGESEEYEEDDSDATEVTIESDTEKDEEQAVTKDSKLKKDKSIDISRASAKNVSVNKSQSVDIKVKETPNKKEVSFNDSKILKDKSMELSKTIKDNSINVSQTTKNKSANVSALHQSAASKSIAEDKEVNEIENEAASINVSKKSLNKSANLSKSIKEKSFNVSKSQLRGKVELIKMEEETSTSESSESDNEVDEEMEVDIESSNASNEELSDPSDMSESEPGEDSYQIITVEPSKSKKGKLKMKNQNLIECSTPKQDASKKAELSKSFADKTNLSRKSLTSQRKSVGSLDDLTDTKVLTQLSVAEVSKSAKKTENNMLKIKENLLIANPEGELKNRQPWKLVPLNQTAQVTSEETPKTKFLKKSKLNDSFPILESMKHRISGGFKNDDSKSSKNKNIKSVNELDELLDQEVLLDKNMKKRKLADLSLRGSIDDDSVLQKVKKNKKRARVEEQEDEETEVIPAEISAESTESKKKKKKKKKNKQATTNDDLQNNEKVFEEVKFDEIPVETLESKVEKPKKKKNKVQKAQSGENIEETNSVNEKQKKKKKKSEEIPLEEISESLESSVDKKKKEKSQELQIDMPESKQSPIEKKKKKKSKVIVFESPVEKQKKKKKSQESEVEVSENSQNSVEKPKKKKKSQEFQIEEDSIPITAEKQKKKKKSNEFQVQDVSDDLQKQVEKQKKKKKSLDIEVDTSVQEISVESKKKKKKLRLSDEKSDQENLNGENIRVSKSTLRLSQDSQKSEKKSKKKKKSDASKTSNNDDDDDEAPESVDFEVARRSALSTMQQVAESVKAQKQARKRKIKEHNERMEKERSESMSNKSLKRLPEEVLEQLADEPAQRPVKRQKLSKNAERKITQSSLTPTKALPPNVKVDDGFISLSSTGGTTQFGVVDLQKAKTVTKKSEAVLNLRSKLLARNPRQATGVYLSYLQKQQAKVDIRK